MGITIEYIGNYHKEANSVIILSENAILKFIPAKSALESNKKLENIIRMSDLLVANEFKKFKSLVKLSDKIKRSIASYISDFNSRPDKKVFFDETKTKITSDSNEIQKMERDLGFSLSETPSFCFCKECHLYLGEYNSLLENCGSCGTEIEEDGMIRGNLLDKEVRNYIDGGIWFEDYVAKLFEKQGWKVWVHGSIMGISGIQHQIDLLAIKPPEKKLVETEEKPKEKTTPEAPDEEEDIKTKEEEEKIEATKIIIVECKTGNISGRDISHFLIQKIDTPSDYGLFVSFENCAHKGYANLAKRKREVGFIDDIKNKNDETITQMINEKIAEI